MSLTRLSLTRSLSLTLALASAGLAGSSCLCLLDANATPTPATDSAGEVKLKPRPSDSESAPTPPQQQPSMQPPHGGPGDRGKDKDKDKERDRDRDRDNKGGGPGGPGPGPGKDGKDDEGKRRREHFREAAENMDALLGFRVPRRRELDMRDHFMQLSRLSSEDIRDKLSKWPPFKKMTLGEQGRLMVRIQDIKDKKKEIALTRARDLNINLRPDQEESFENAYWDKRLAMDRALFQELEPRRRELEDKMRNELLSEFGTPPAAGSTPNVAPAPASTNAPASAPSPAAKPAPVSPSNSTVPVPSSAKP